MRPCFFICFAVLVRRFYWKCGFPYILRKMSSKWVFVTLNHYQVCVIIRLEQTSDGNKEVLTSFINLHQNLYKNSGSQAGIFVCKFSAEMEKLNCFSFVGNRKSEPCPRTGRRDGVAENFCRNKNLSVTDPPISTDIEVDRNIWKNKKYLKFEVFLLCQHY